MGRGRAPCCDKSRVVRGPWSHAEDLKLIACVNTYGHDNWRFVPKQAGLLRCGKSCRLRWVNYLRPDLKRGNYSPEEEDTIIRLHKTLGNKWSKIASHLPGRTDNEIKNVWNTHLKKRLAKKDVEDVTKETSVITSSSSSSATVESNSKHQKSEIQSQIRLLAREENKMKTDGTGFTDMALSKIYQTTAGNQATDVNGCTPFNKFDPIPQQSGQNLDSNGNYQHEKIPIWEDTSLLESMLNEVDDPNWLQAPTNTQSGSIVNNYSCELNMEFDFDFWSMLDTDVIPAPDKPDQNNAEDVLNMETPMRNKGMITPYKYAEDKDISSMVRYLENEAGLAQQSVGVFEKQKQNQKDDVNNSFSAAAPGPRVNRMPIMNDFSMWPQSPIYFFEGAP